MVDEVSVDSMIWNLQRLSGEVPVDVGGGPVTITSRNKFNPGNAVAADWLQQRLVDYGYTPVVQVFSGGTGENVLAEKVGAVHPDVRVVICGHYDAMPGTPAAAPAADDDGSGTVAVLEAARILASYTFENTIVFAMWDEEEQGKLGSLWYAGILAANDDTLAGAVNMDAIAYDGNGDDLMRIHTRPVANSIAIKDTAVMANTTYGMNLPIAINNPGATYSDHASFWTEGFGAILIIEDFDNDGNPHYHTTTDLIQYLDLPYFERLTRLGIATTALLAVPYDSPSAVQEPIASQFVDMMVIPNPVGDQGIIKIHTELPGQLDVDLINGLGMQVARLNRGTLDRGTHVFRIPRSLPAGAYTAHVSDLRGAVANARFIVLDR